MIWPLIKRSRSALMLIALLIIAFSSCATPPFFNAGEKVAESASLQEALLLCNEYKVNEVVRRPIVLLPYVTCVTDISRTHSMKSNGSFDVFKQELKQSYDLLQEGDWRRSTGIEMEIGIRALFRALWRGNTVSSGDVYTEDEKLFASRYFPRTSKKIGVSQWRIRDVVSTNMEIENIRAVIASFFVYSYGFVGEASDKCGLLRLLITESAYLAALWLDRTEMVKEFGLVNESVSKIDERIKKRIADAKQQLEMLRMDKNFEPSRCPQ